MMQGVKMCSVMGVYFLLKFWDSQFCELQLSIHYILFILYDLYTILHLYEVCVTRQQTQFSKMIKREKGNS